MSIFSSLNKASLSSSVVDPKRLFRALSKPPASRFKFPHDIQTEVWDAWFAVRDHSDVVIKMNTGSGKTAIGLVILRSSLNEGRGPAVYLVPDHQLLDQVTKTASELGIAWTTDPRDAAFRQEEAILVIPAHTLYNGLSKFGVMGEGNRKSTKVGTVVIDDAHACIPIIENQFSLRLPKSSAAYGPLFGLFDEALKGQSMTGYAGLVDGSGSHAVPVPYWEWQAKIDAAFPILNSVADEGDNKFVWSLLREQLALCEVALTPGEIEIRLPYPDLAVVPSFTDAERRIFMTATLADDAILVTKMGASVECVTNPITPSSASDLGDRLILTPIETSKEVTTEDVKASAIKWSKSENVIVIVPSRFRAKAWEDATSEVHDKTTIKACITRLTNGEHVGLVVLVGRYDGVDLPNGACRVLILDGLPERYSPQELVEATAIGGTEAMDARQTQRIEQGMGRGVRSTADYCAVLLLDPRLVERLYSASNRRQLSPGTRAQYELSVAFSQNGRGQPMSYFDAAVDAFLARDPEWIDASKSALEEVVYDKLDSVSAVVTAEREAYELALSQRFQEAFDVLIAAAPGVKDSRTRGWIKQRAAAYLNRVDPGRAREVQKSARIDNNYLLKVDLQIQTKRLTASGTQAKASTEFLSSTFSSGTALEIGVEALLRDLEPTSEKNSHRRFEAAIERVGYMLGFSSSRPDQETGVGPDNLWAVGGDHYWVIECKSEVVSEPISRSDLEQLSHSIDWFDKEYSDDRFVALPVLIHLSKKPNWDAIPRQGARVMTFERLAEFRTALRDFAASLRSEDGFRNEAVVKRSLTEFLLTAGTLEQKWTEKFTGS